MSTEPITHLEHVVAGTTTPVTHLEKVIAENSGGGSVTVDDAISNSSENPVQNKVISAALALKADTTALNNKSDKPTTTTISGSTPTIAAADNTIYNCGELTSLTSSNPPATGSYVIKFTSGSTATTTTIPASIIFPEAFAAEANTRYEINVEDGFAVAVGWPVS